MPFGGKRKRQETDMDLNTRLTAPPQVLSRLVGDETVLLNLESGIYFGLDGVGQCIWDAVSEGKTLAETIDVIVAEYDVSEQQAQNNVLEFAANLVERGLLVR
jgi:hypothetical protein